MDALVHRLQYVVAAVLLVVIVGMLPSLVSAASFHSQQSNSFSTDMTSSPNAVTRSFGYAMQATVNSTNRISASISATARSSARFTQHIGSYSLSGIDNSARFVGDITAATAHGISRGMIATVSLPVHAVGGVARAINPVRVLRPADAVAAPSINPSAAVLAAADTKPAVKAQPIVNEPSGVIWPLHGAITTLFGVPEPPYEPIHTGIDISDGEPAGVTPIHAFKPGIVIQVIHEHIRLGNEVIIDHGHGMTSVYGHLDSTAVRVGQLVTTRTIIGREGTTGVSTGPHLHFEIRINGVPKNPMNYIPGKP